MHDIRNGNDFSYIAVPLLTQLYSILLDNSNFPCDTENLHAQLYGSNTSVGSIRWKWGHQKCEVMNIKMLKYSIYSDLQIGAVGWGGVCGRFWLLICLFVLDGKRKLLQSKINIKLFFIKLFTHQMSGNMNRRMWSAVRKLSL